VCKHGLLPLGSNEVERGNILSSVWFEYKITIDDHPDWKPRPYRKRWLIVQIATHLLTSLIEGIPCAAAQRAKDVIVISTGADLRRRAKQRRKRCSFEEFTPVVIDLVFKTSISGGISTWLAFEHNGASVRQNEPSPYQEHAGLPKCDLAIVTADQSRTLRN
jgi:hypothetical protein